MAWLELGTAVLIDMRSHTLVYIIAAHAYRTIAKPWMQKAPWVGIGISRSVPLFADGTLLNRGAKPVLIRGAPRRGGTRATVWSPGPCA